MTDKHAECRHCGASITHRPGDVVAAPGYEAAPAWRAAFVRTGQVWCSRNYTVGPPHAPAGLPDLRDTEALAAWLDEP